MAAVIAADGLIDEAAAIATVLDGLNIFLFVNNYTPLTSSTFADFTEPTYTGYAQQAVTGSTPGSISGNNIPIPTAQKTFSVTGTGGTDVVYGYGLIDGSGNLYAAERFAGGPYNMQTSGDTIRLTITETLTRT